MRYFSKFAKQNGFTLTELVVVIAIAAVIIGALIIEQSKWNDRLSVGTQAYELALMIRQAQIYSLGVREYAAGAGDKFNIGYGVHTDASNFGQYIFFADSNRNLKYNSGEDAEVKSLTRGVTINRICGFQSGVEQCSGAGALRQISVSFFRPEPKANLSFLNSAGNVISSFTAPAIIYLRSAGNKESSVKIEANGQVSVIQ